MSTILDQYRAKAQAGGGDSWVEEVLIRGTKDGGIAGAHLRVGWEAEGVDGKVAGVTGALPLSLAPNNPLWQQVAAAINAAGLDDLTVARADLVTAIEERDAALRQVLQLTAQVADAQAALAAAEGVSP